MSQKSKNEGAKETNPSKKKKGNKAKETLTKANLESAAKKAEETKESKTLKYRYPDDISTPEKKKAFRRNARAQRDKFNKTLETLKKSNEEKDKKEYSKMFKEHEQWAKKTYLAPEAQ